MEYHLEAKATNCIKTAIMSLPFSGSLHNTIIGDLLCSFKRIERTLGVRTGIDCRSRLKRAILRNPISLINLVHFLLRSHRLVLIWHWMIFTWEIIQNASLLGFIDLILLLLLSIAFDFSHVAPQDEKLIL